MLSTPCNSRRFSPWRTHLPGQAYARETIRWISNSAGIFPFFSVLNSELYRSKLGERTAVSIFLVYCCSRTRSRRYRIQTITEGVTYNVEESDRSGKGPSKFWLDPSARLVVRFVEVPSTEGLLVPAFPTEVEGGYVCPSESQYQVSRSVRSILWFPRLCNYNRDRPLSREASMFVVRNRRGVCSCAYEVYRFDFFPI